MKRVMILLLACLLGACASQGQVIVVTATPPPETETPIPPTETPLPTNTPLPPPTPKPKWEPISSNARCGLPQIPLHHWRWIERI
jgi:PBP1b-binding outer membrane lipoprotein LpoB